MKRHLRLMRPGDWLVLGLATTVCAALLPLLWRGGVAEKAVVKRDGTIVAELSLNTPRKLDVTGPLGITIIEVQPGRARILSDPGPRQYCVRQGWLTRANAVAICAPNHVSLALVGRGQGYDSLTY